MKHCCGGQGWGVGQKQMMPAHGRLGQLEGGLGVGRGYVETEAPVDAGACGGQVGNCGWGKTAVPRRVQRCFGVRLCTEVGGP